MTRTRAPFGSGGAFDLRRERFVNSFARSVAADASLARPLVYVYIHRSTQRAALVAAWK